jgi:hypothetical protein
LGSVLIPWVPTAEEFLHDAYRSGWCRGSGTVFALRSCIRNCDVVARDQFGQCGHRSDLRSVQFCGRRHGDDERSNARHDAEHGGQPGRNRGSIPVYISSYDGTTYFPPLLAYETFVGVHSTGAATSSGGTISQTYAGEVEFLNATGTVDYLTATFTNAVFSGSGFSASLNATAPNLTFSSNVSTFGPNTGMSIAFSGISPGLSETGGVLRGFTAQNAGDFSTSAIPEPSTLCLSAIAVIAGAAVARSRKKMKDRK